ncbi:carbon-nitrogen hydrolase family protein [Muricoccus aerilatus]|uniref:carbon-nitrogen hydrolase family protein n=1 Tax=Muricoccus aerilatus TaxID=452982 RepID=UPI001FE1C927|nr:carbon-nitrogen hydrolase family protein [Roseomonas aerilata]
MAAVQAAPAFLDLQGSVAKCIALIDEAAAASAALVAFPETFIPGYPWWIWHHSPASIFQHGFVERYFENALSYDSPEAALLAEAAARRGIVVVLGLAERCGGSLYIGQWILSSSGATLLRRRKLKPTHVERAVFGEGAGSDLAVVDSELGRLGALNCWEHLQPLSKYAMYAQNEQIHVAAWPSLSSGQGRPVYALGHEVNNAASQIYAVEGGCFVVAPCALVSQEMVDLVCTDDRQRAAFVKGGGRAMIYGPDGRPLSEPPDPEFEGLVMADVDLGRIALAKSLVDPVGHYARPDVVRLLLDRSPAMSVMERDLSNPVDDTVRHATAARTTTT